MVQTLVLKYLHRKDLEDSSQMSMQGQKPGASHPWSIQDNFSTTTDAIHNSNGMEHHQFDSHLSV
jgi:hypothetical protein